MAATALTLRNQTLLPGAPIGSLEAYMSTISSIPVLSREEEFDLAERFSREGDLESARQLVISNLRFVVHIARGYSGYGLQLGDLVQEGNVGLMKAVKRFDPDYGVRLISFAVHWIRAEIHEFVLRNWRIVKVATTKAQRKLFFNLRRAKKHLGWLSTEERKAVAADLGVSAADVNEMEQRLAAHDLGFDGANSDDDENNFAPVAYLPAPEPDPLELVADDESRQDLHGKLFAALDTLDERSRHILEARWIAEKKTTLRELAGEYGVSAERIRQIEANALRKLRQ
ncbi:MAG: RNA polymerase sigma factor RpoH, partial [Gammaproteobacteria bacterium]|nr:RNA polymerase sigma factor RpoH [Gammaproteobacteria bacterium]